MVHNIADIVPNGVATPLSSSPTHAAWVQIVADGSNGAVIRVGDSTTSATRGIAMTAGSGFMLPPIGGTNTYQLSAIYVYGASGSDSFSCVYGVL